MRSPPSYKNPETSQSEIHSKFLAFPSLLRKISPAAWKGRAVNRIPEIGRSNFDSGFPFTPSKRTHPSCVRRSSAPWRSARERPRPFSARNWKPETRNCEASHAHEPRRPTRRGEHPSRVLRSASRRALFQSQNHHFSPVFPTFLHFFHLLLSALHAPFPRPP